MISIQKFVILSVGQNTYNRRFFFFGKIESLIPSPAF